MAINEMSCPPRSQTGMAELESFGFQTDRWRPALCAHEHRLCMAGCLIAAVSNVPEELPICRAAESSGSAVALLKLPCNFLPSRIHPISRCVMAGCGSGWALPTTLACP